MGEAWEVGDSHFFGGDAMKQGEVVGSGCEKLLRGHGGAVIDAVEGFENAGYAGIGVR